MTELKVVENNQEVKELDSTKATVLLNTFEQVNSIKHLREELNAKRLDFFTEDKVSRLEDRIKYLVPEQLKEFTPEAIDHIYTFDDETLEFDVKFETEERRIEFKRDFLVYLVESAHATLEIDKQIDQLEKTLDDSKEEVKELLSQYADLSDYIRSTLVDELETAKTEERRTKVTRMIEAFDDATTLDRVYAQYNQFGTKTTVSDYFHRSTDVYTRYLKIMKKIDFRTDLTRFDNLETKFLPEKYHALNNIFVFAIIKMMSHKKSATRDDEGTFLTQLAVNLKYLYADSFSKPEQKELFISSITRVLDLFLEESAK